MISKRDAMLKVLRFHLDETYVFTKIKGYITIQKDFGDGFIVRITHVESASKPVSICVQYKGFNGIPLINFIEPKVPIERIEETVNTLHNRAKKIIFK